MMKPTFRATALAALALFWAGSAMAQDVPRQITVTGAGEVSVRPDVTRISLGVQADGETAKAALDEMSGHLAAIFAELDAAGIAEEDRQTTGLRLDPIYDQDERDGRTTRTLAGYRASSMLQVRLAGTDTAGALIDTLAQAGANRIDGIAFEIADPETPAADARRRAVENAARQAGEFAAAANVALGEVISITEHGSARPRPMAAGARMAEAGFAVPVAEGSISVEATVTVVYRIADAE